LIDTEQPPNAYSKPPAPKQPPAPIAGQPEGRPTHRTQKLSSLHIEYVERRAKYGILIIFSLFCEYSHREYVRFNIIYIIYRDTPAEYVIHMHMRVVAPQEYVNIYSINT